MNGIRWVLVCVTPIFMVWGFISVLVREIGRAFYYAWLEARIELESAQRSWRRWND